MAHKGICLHKLQTAERELGKQRTLKPKIQKVHETLKDQGQYELYYKPKVVSFGPIHHHLEPGDSKKYEWAVEYMKKHLKIPNEEKTAIEEKAEKLCKKIADNMVQLKESYSEDVIKGYSDEKLAWMFLVDGCAMLYLLKSFVRYDFEKIQVVHISLLPQDLVLLENQLPYKLLELLTDNTEQLTEDINNFYKAFHPLSEGRIPRNGNRPREQFDNVGGLQHTVQVEEPIHLLDRIRKFMIRRRGHRNDDGRQTPRESTGPEAYSWSSIHELKEKGIFRVKRDKDAALCDVSFHPGLFAGYLHLPPMLINEWSAPLFHNLKAYELCPDFYDESEICSFLVFINLLVNSEEDVKELRSAGVLVTRTVTDKKAAELISDMIRGIYMARTSSSKWLLKEIDRYFNCRCKGWVAELYNTYFSSPWSIIACIAAGIGLVLTFLRTLHSFNSRSG